MSPTVRCYQREMRGDYYYCPDNDDFGYCRDDLMHQSNFSPSGKTWVVAYRYEWEKLGGFDGRFRVEDVADGRNVGGRQLVLRLIRGRAVDPAQWLGQIDAAGGILARLWGGDVWRRCGCRITPSLRCGPGSLCGAAMGAWKPSGRGGGNWGNSLAAGRIIVGRPDRAARFGMMVWYY